MKHIKLFEGFNSNPYKGEWPIIDLYKHYNYNGPIDGKGIMERGFKQYVYDNPFLRSWFIDYGRSEWSDGDIENGVKLKDTWNIFDDDGYLWYHTDENISDFLQLQSNAGINDILHKDVYAIVMSEILNEILNSDPRVKKTPPEDEISAIQMGPEDLTHLIDFRTIENGIKKAREKSIDSLIKRGFKEGDPIDIHSEEDPDYPPFDIWVPDVAGIVQGRRGGYGHSDFGSKLRSY